jgi:hypothetical protein
MRSTLSMTEVLRFQPGFTMGGGSMIHSVGRALDMRSGARILPRRCENSSCDLAARTQHGQHGHGA